MKAVVSEEGKLIERCRAGDRAGFDELVLKYQDRLYNLAYRLTGHAEDAADITQDAFLKAFRNIGKFEGSSSFYTWIYRIAVNAVLSRRRYNAVRPRAIPLDAKDAKGRPMDPADPLQADPSDLANRGDVRRIVEQAIGRLEADQKVLVVLRDLEGRDYNEIAEILDCPRGTVKSRLHRARCALRDMLAAVLPSDAEL